MTNKYPSKSKSVNLNENWQVQGVERKYTNEQEINHDFQVFKNETEDVLSLKSGSKNEDDIEQWYEEVFI